MSVLGRIARGGALAQYEGGPSGGPAVNVEPWIEALRSSGSTAAGKAVTVPGALGVAAVWACVRVLADTVGTLPLMTYRRRGDDRQRATDTRPYVFELTNEKGEPDPRTYTSREIIHLFGFSLDGMVGLSPIGYARESIGAALAMDEYANSFFRA